MSILKYKYKAHKFINYIFYIIVFLVGFLIGFSTEKIKFNKLISQVLMIENVSAYNITSTINEEYIYNQFSSNADFDISVYHNIFCLYDSSFSIHRYCYALSDDAISHTQFSYSTSGNIVIKLASSYTYNVNPTPGFYLDLRNNSVSDLSTWQYGFSITITYSSSNSKFYFSFIPPNYNDSSWFGNRNLLDFSEYSVKLEYNENLFEDNPDFKEVCVPNNKDFAISTNNYELNEDETSEYYGSKSYSSYGFIWFPYYINRMESYLYDNSKTDNIWIPEEDETYFDLHPIFHYWLDSKEEIDRVWSLEDPGSFLNSLGYTDKYSYFGWYAHPFVVRYANSGLRQFSIFRFSDDVEFYSTLENGLDYFEKLENARNGNVCFYIRKDFDVTLLNTDEFGDKYGDISIMEDEKLEVSTTQNISNIDSKGLFEKVKLFLNKMTKPIDFVKDYIFELYDSMPYLLKLFIISVFGLIVIKILIGMVVR